MQRRSELACVSIEIDGIKVVAVIVSNGPRQVVVAIHEGGAVQNAFNPRTLLRRWRLGVGG